jgi:hypothetical protein
MKRYLALVLAIVLGFSLLSPVSVRAQGFGTANALPAKEVTQEEAAKNYPPPKGQSYPQGIPIPTNKGGWFQSPYSGRVYDLKKVKKGTLVLDEPAKKVFLRP